MTAHRRLPRINSDRTGTHSAFAASHAKLLVLCSQLEDFADALPNRLELRLCGETAQLLVPTLRQCHKVEESCFETLAPQAVKRLTESLDRMRSEHRRDQYLAEEIAEALHGISESRPMANPDAMGFMLRSFFEVQRRHIAFEKEHILPALAARRNLI